MGIVTDDIVVEISFGSTSVLLDFTYYFRPQDDPWRARQPGIIGALSGTWRHANVSDGEVTCLAPDPQTGQTNRVLVLNGFGTRIMGDPFRRVGQSGNGMHYFSRAIIPADQNITWRVVSIT